MNPMLYIYFFYFLCGFQNQSNNCNMYNQYKNLAKIIAYLAFGELRNIIPLTSTVYENQLVFKT